MCIEADRPADQDGFPGTDRQAKGHEGLNVQWLDYIAVVRATLSAVKSDRRSYPAIGHGGWWYSSAVRQR